MKQPVKDITPELIKHVALLQERGTPAVAIKKLISQKTGFKKTKSNEIYHEITGGISRVAEPKGKEDAEEFWATNLETLEKPYFNNDTKQYIVFIGALGRNIVVPESQHRSILQMYSKWDGEERSITEVCRTLQWPKQVLTEYLKKFGITHDSLPLTDEDLQGEPDDVLVSRLQELRKFSIYQKMEKESWDSIRGEAAKFRALKYKEYDPFQDFLARWKPVKYEPLQEAELFKDTSKDVYVVGLSDLHFGLAANARFMYNREGWSTEKTVSCVDKFVTSIVKDVTDRKVGFKKCVVLCLGDFIHSMYGKTARGTELEFDTIKEDQFDYAMNSLVSLFTRLSGLFKNIEVHAVYGNHHYEVEMALFKALQAYFRTQKGIKFNLYSTRPAAFKVDATLFLIDHGADSRIKAWVPGINGPKRQSFIQSLLLSKPDLLQGVKTKLFCQGDKHHWENIEYNDFEFIMFSTIIGGDQYAASSNWQNKARQSCLILNEDGLKSILHTYF
jgi:hypothetical protein